MKRFKISIIINSIIFILMIIGLVMSFTGLKFDLRIGDRPSFGYLIKFFTVESNIFMGIMALLYVINAILHLKNGTEMNKYVFIFKYVSTVCVGITFFVVALILAPLFSNGNYFSLFYDANFFFHFFIPVSSILTFILLENRNDFSIKITITGVIPFSIYTIFYLIAALTHMEGGKVQEGYDWYGFLYFGIPIFIVLAIATLILIYLISFIIYFLNKKLYKAE